MKQFDEDFKEKLYATIQDIENNSMVEVVAVIKSASDKYRDISLWIAFAFMSLLFSVMMFIPQEIDAYLIYLITILSFPIIFIIAEAMPNLKRRFISKKRINRQTEIMARAIFQKGNVRHTKEKIGVLFFASLLEQKIVVLPDRGAETSVPLEDWNKINSDFSKIFAEKNKSQAFINALQQTKSIFNQNIPPIEDDINELPDNLEVEF